MMSEFMTVILLIFGIIIGVIVIYGLLFIVIFFHDIGKQFGNVIDRKVVVTKTGLIGENKNEEITITEYVLILRKLGFSEWDYEHYSYSVETVVDKDTYDKIKIGDMFYAGWKKPTVLAREVIVKTIDGIFQGKYFKDYRGKLVSFSEEL